MAHDHPSLFAHQNLLTKWALRKGRAAIFAGTGLGKTRMQLTWANEVVLQTGYDVVIFAPLAVAEQTCREGKEIGIDVNHCHDNSDVQCGINISNYERLHKFDSSQFGAIVLDESSIIKHHESRTLQLLMDSFRDTPFKLCCTATPAPNDHMELGTHAEFLGICSRSEMLSEFFVHDAAKTQDWRLKGHAREAFWRWVASWGAMLQNPADLGLDGSMYRLPPLRTLHIEVESNAKAPDGELFARPAQTLMDRRRARRDSLQQRISACADMVNRSKDIWIVWCELNQEGDALEASIPDSVQIAGADSTEKKEKALQDFSGEKIRVLITKPKIAGFGLNWQHCHNIGFIGVTDSWESYYQAVRRCWRFGQQHPVNAYLFASEQEGAIKENLERKEKAAEEMYQYLRAETMAAVKDEVFGVIRKTNPYNAVKIIQIPEFMK